MAHPRLLEYLWMPRLKLPFVWVLTARAIKYTLRASAPQVEFQPEVKVKSREKERERRRKREKDTGGARVPRNQAERLVREAGPRNWPPAAKDPGTASPCFQDRDCCQEPVIAEATSPSCFLLGTAFKKLPRVCIWHKLGCY